MANEKEEEIEDEVRKTYSRIYFWSDRTEYKFASRCYLRSSRENAHQKPQDLIWVVAKFVNFFSFSLSVLTTNKINFLWRAHLSLSLYRRNTPRRKKTRRSTTTVRGVFLYVSVYFKSARAFLHREGGKTLFFSSLSPCLKVDQFWSLTLRERRERGRLRMILTPHPH